MFSDLISKNNKIKNNILQESKKDVKVSQSCANSPSLSRYQTKGVFALKLSGKRVRDSIDDALHNF